MLFTCLFPRNIMPELLEAKDAEEAKIGDWVDSAKHQGKSTDAEICCNEAGTSCEPFPECCDCEFDGNRMQNLNYLDPDRRKPSFNEEWDT